MKILNTCLLSHYYYSIWRFNSSQKNGHLTIIIGKETRKLYNLHKERLADIETHNTKYLTRITNTKCL